MSCAECNGAGPSVVPSNDWQRPSARVWVQTNINRTPHGADYVISWRGYYMDGHGHAFAAWTTTIEDQEPPAQPTRWKPLA